VSRFLSSQIFKKLSGFRPKNTAGMTYCRNDGWGGPLHSNIDELVKRYTGCCFTISFMQPLA